MADRIIIDFQVLDRISDRLNAAGRELDLAMSQLAHLYVTRDAGADVRISGCGTSLRTTSMTVRAETVSAAVSSYKSAVGSISGYTSRLGEAVRNAYELFEATENSLSGKKLDTGEAAPANEGSGSNGFSLKEFKKFLVWILLYHPGISLIFGSLNDGILSVIPEFSGVEFADGHPGVTAWIKKASASVSGDLGSAEVNAYLGKVKAEVKADGGIMKYSEKSEYKDGKWSEKETLSFLYGELGAGLSASMFTADAKGTVGNDMLGLEGNAAIDIFNANLEGKVKVDVGEGGITAVAKGEAMVAAAKGKASGTINILGLEITGEVGGYAGAAGVEGKIGIENGKFVANGGVAALLGVSAGVTIGFNDTGWSKIKSDFVDFASFIGSLW